MSKPHAFHLTSLGAALASCLLLAPDAARAISVSNLSDGSLNGNTLTVSADVGDVAGTTTVTLYLGAAAPKDGDPANLLAVADTKTISAAGTVSFDAFVVLGTKVAFKIVADDGTVAESGVKTLTAYDETEYYCNNKTGVWSDPSIWDKGTDSGRRLGYPSYGGKFIFSGGTCNVSVDAEYTELRGKSFGWNGVTVTLTGTVEGAALKGNYGVECYTADLTLDNVRVECASYDIKAGKSLRLVNGASFSTLWWINVNRDNATFYVGSGSTVYASTEGWRGITLSGQNAIIDIDDGYIYTRRLHIGRDGNTTTAPSGIRFSGSSPRLVVHGGCLITRNDLVGSPIFEFVVPQGGYATAPISRDTASSDFAFAGHSYLDNPNSVYGAPPILFKVNEYSPFFSGPSEEDILLVDWSHNGTSAAGINTDATDCGIDYVAFEDPDHNRFYTDSNVSGVDATRLWVHLTGTGEPASKTLVGPVVSGSVSDTTLTATATLSEYDGGNGTSTATLYVGHAGPAGDPTANMAAAATASITGDGPVTLSTSGLVLGSQTAYAIVVENTQGQWFYSTSTATNIVQVRDPNVEYRWVNNNTGLWSDPANWTCTATDGKARLGYPSYGNGTRWYGNQTAVVFVDGSYTGLGDAKWDNSGLSLTLVGTVEDAATKFAGVATDGSDKHVVLDNVDVTVGSYSLNNNDSLLLRNGATLQTQWQFTLWGDNALLRLESGSRLDLSMAENWHGLYLIGENSRVEIDHATLNTYRLWFGEGHQSAARDSKNPDGIYFYGESPALVVRGPAQMRKSYVSPKFVFSIPESGYGAAPVRGTSGNETFLDSSAGSGVPVALFQIDRRSPFLNETSRATDIPLVAWDNAAGINTSGIELSQTDSSCRFFYTPAEDTKKTGLWVHAQGHGYTLLVIQ